jgi:hypothetical protein
VSTATTPVTDTSPVPRHRRVPVALLAVWVALLVAGFALVFTLGAPLPSSGQQRTDAYAPLPLPLTEEAAIAAAERIVRLDYSSYADATRTVRHGTSQGEIWTITYSRHDPTAGVRITISGTTGEIRVAPFP